MAQVGKKERASALSQCQVTEGYDMCCKCKTMVIIWGILLITAVNAQQHKNDSNRDADEIFNSIMQTMPDEKKARVDSASSVSKSMKKTGDTGKKSMAKTGTSGKTIDRNEVSIEHLPEAVRRQISKTMQEVEQQKVDHMIEFKEIREKNNAN